MDRFLRIAATFILLAAATLAQAQPRPGQYRQGRNGGFTQDIGNQSRGFIVGTVVLSPDDPGGKEVPGQGVVVVVETARKDTLYTTVNERGSFMIANVPVGKARVSFSMLGYETLSNYADISPGANKMIANLQPEKLKIDAAVVKEYVEPITVIKDTIVFNASAVKVNKGERAIDILEQMPGVEVSDSGVKVLNEDVKNVYIDGALLFGNAPMKALNNLAAEEVVTIKSYQEYANKDPHHKISKTEEKERVLNVSTKSKPKMVVSGDMVIGGGFDTDTTYRKFRYTLGGNAALYSEKLVGYVSVNINNINDDSNFTRGNSFRTASRGSDASADLKSLSVNANVNKRWMSPTTRNFVLGQLSLGYSLSDRYNVSESKTQMVYFPSDKFTSREVDRTSYTSSTSKRHSFSAGGQKSLKDGMIGLNAEYSINSSLSDSRSTNYNIQDGMSPQGTASGSRRTGEGSSFNSSFNIRKGFNHKISLGFNASFNMSDNDNVTVKEDTTTTTVTYKVLNIDGMGQSRSWNLSPSIRYNINDNMSLRFDYKYNDSFSTTEQLAYDITDISDRKMDMVNTMHYTNANRSHTAVFEYSAFIDKIQSGLSMGVEYNSVGISKDETLPAEDYYDRRFETLKPFISLSSRGNSITNYRISYSAGGNTPSLEQIRPRIDNSNLYSVSAGNPDLQQSITHHTNFSLSTIVGRKARETFRSEKGGMGLGGFDDGMAHISSGHESRVVRYGRGGGSEMSTLSTLDLVAKFDMTSNPIVRRQMYYVNETYLPQYDYTMPAQSTFSTYENVSDSYNGHLTVRFSSPIPKIMCMINTGLGFTFDSAPSFVDYELTRTNNFRPTATLGLRSNFSRNIRLSINGSGSYIYSNNSAKDATEYFTETLNFGCEINNILKHGYIGGNYSKQFTQGLDLQNVNDNILNINGGMRFGPKNQFTLSVNVHDLLNSTTGFSTSMNSNYITNSWRHNFGRYVMFKLNYRFTTAKGGRGGMGRMTGGGGFPGGMGR